MPGGDSQRAPGTATDTLKHVPARLFLTQVYIMLAALPVLPVVWSFSHRRCLHHENVIENIVMVLVIPCSAGEAQR